MRELVEWISLSHRHSWKVCSSVGYVKNKKAKQCTSYLTVGRERERAHTSLVWSLLMFAHLARIIWIKTILNIYKTIYRGIHYKHHLFSTLSIHDFLAKVKLAACVKCARLYCTCPSHSAPVQICARVARFACFMRVSALYEWLWNINQMKRKMRLLFLKISQLLDL